MKSPVISLSSRWLVLTAKQSKLRNVVFSLGSHIYTRESEDFLWRNSDAKVNDGLLSDFVLYRGRSCIVGNTKSWFLPFPFLAHTFLLIGLEENRL